VAGRSRLASLGAPFGSRRLLLGSIMSKRPKKASPSTPSPDPHVAAFRALRDLKQAFKPEPKTSAPKAQKPRAKQQLRRRP
jgi:hypothetical protein